MKYLVVANKTEYGFDMKSSDFCGCHSHGVTFKEAIENIRDALKYTSW